jgi:hypothetical protein
MDNKTVTTRITTENYVEQFKRIFEEKKIIRINGYVREANNERLNKSSYIVDVNIDYSYYELLKESYKKLYSISDNQISHLAKKYDTEFENSKRAISEMKESVRDSMTRIETGGTDEDDVRESFKKIVNGVTEDIETQVIYILGIVEREMVLVPPRLREVKHKPETLIKKEIMKNLPHNLRKFKIKKNDFHKINIV